MAKGDKHWPNTWTEVEDLGGGKFGASISVGHRVFFDKADGNKPKKHKLTDERPTKDYVLIQSAKCCVEVYPYYATYFDVQHEEVRLYEERWIVQRLFKKPDTWRDVDAYNPVVTVEEYPEPAGDVVKVNVTYDTDYGVLGVEYFQRDGNNLKHNVTFKNTSGSAETFRVVQAWTGIVGSKCNGKDIPVVEDAPYFAFHNSDKPQKNFNIAENLYSMVFNPDGSERTDQCLQRPISVETHAQGMKADFIYGNWILHSGETFAIGSIHTKVPTSCDEGWTDCFNVQIDDSTYAEAITNGQTGEWGDFGFAIETAITTVRLRVKTYVLDDAKHSISLQVWNGSEWGASHDIVPTEIPCSEEIIDVTGDFEWTPSMVNAIKVMLTANIGGGAPANKKVRCCFILLEVDYVGGSPATAMLDDPTEDGDITWNGATYVRDKEGWYMGFGAYGMAPPPSFIPTWMYDKRAYVEWDITGLAGASLTANPVFKYHGMTDITTDEEINSLTEEAPLGCADSDLYGYIASGAAYVDPWAFEATSGKSDDLGSSAKSDLQSAIDALQSWFAIGIQDPGREGSTSGDPSSIYTEDKADPTANPKPTLYVEYEAAPPAYIPRHSGTAGVLIF